MPVTPAKNQLAEYPQASWLITIPAARHPGDRAEAESLAWRIGDQSRYDINQRFPQESYPDSRW